MKLGVSVKKAISVVEYVFVGFVTLCLLFVLYSNMNGNTLFVFGRSALWVKTESMEPVIPRQSYILVRQPDERGINVGDVIVFHSDDPVLNGMLNTHRVVEITNGGTEFVTKGDHNAVADSYTAKADKVIGIYERNLPVLSFLGRFLSTSGGIAMMTTLLLMVVVAVFMPDVLENARKKAEQEKQEHIEQLIQAAVAQLVAEHENGEN